MGNSFIQAMLLGKMEGLPSEVVFLFARTGLIHLFSASGFHLGVAIGLSKLLARILSPICSYKTQNLFTFLLSLCIMTFFGASTGWASPMVRAYVFTSLRSLAGILGIRENKNWIFLLSLLFASQLGRGGQISFFLSAAGMIGILYLPKKHIFWGPWLFTMPICVYCFHLFSLSSIVWNLSFGAYFAWICLPPAIMELLLNAIGVSAPFLGKWAASSAELGIDLLQKGDQLLPLSYWVPTMPWITTSIFLLLLYKWRQKKVLWLSPIALFIPLLFPEPVFSALDIGQGDSILLKLKNGKKILVDAGPPKYGVTALAKEGISRIDYFLLTHPDLDHRGGIESIALQHRIGEAWLRREALEQNGGLAFLETMERTNTPVHFLSETHAPEEIQCWLSPANNKNNISPLCKANLFGNKSAILTGDMSAEAESWFLHNLSPFPQGEILKVAHHGSKFSSSLEFLFAVNAKKAVISVGKNRYGHPTEEAMERMRKLGLRIYRTDRNGAVNFFNNKWWQ